jgi:hypothetical protein
VLVRLSSLNFVPEEVESGSGLVLRTGSKFLLFSDLVDEAELAVEEPGSLALDSGCVLGVGALAAEYLLSILSFAVVSPVLYHTKFFARFTYVVVEVIQPEHRNSENDPSLSLLHNDRYVHYSHRRRKKETFLECRDYVKYPITWKQPWTESVSGFNLAEHATNRDDSIQGNQSSRTI